MTKSVYDVVTEQVLEQLEAGVVPWHRPWSASGGVPTSMSSGKAYRGINPFLLACSPAAGGSPWWGTYKHIEQLGGQVRKGEKGTLVVFWKQLRVEPSAEERAAGVKVKVVPMLRYFKVFNAGQADGLPAKFYPEVVEGAAFDPIGAAEEIVAGWGSKPTIGHGRRDGRSDALGRCRNPSADHPPVGGLPGVVGQGAQG